MSKRFSQTEHDALLLNLGEFCLEQGFSELRLDLPDAFCARPDTLRLLQSDQFETPDASGMFEGQEYIFEVETEDSVEDEHTVSQWRIIAEYTAETGKKMVIAVPGQAVETVWRRLEELGIKGAEVWALG